MILDISLIEGYIKESINKIIKISKDLTNDLWLINDKFILKPYNQNELEILKQLDYIIVYYSNNKYFIINYIQNKIYNFKDNILHHNLIESIIKHHIILYRKEKVNFWKDIVFDMVNDKSEYLKNIYYDIRSLMSCFNIARSGIL